MQKLNKEMLFHGHSYEIATRYLLHSSLIAIANATHWLAAAVQESWAHSHSYVAKGEC